MSKVQRTNSSDGVRAAEQAIANSLKAAEAKAAKALQAKQNEIDQQLQQLEQLAPQLKPQLESLRNQVDHKFSVERSALESKLKTELGQLEQATGGAPDPATTSTPQKGSTTHKDTTHKSGTQQVSSPSIPKSGNAFIDAVAQGAVEGQQKYGVPASVTIAQAILESGWGKSGLAKSAHNLFGIKGSGPAGSVTMPTREVINGHSVTVNAAFRKYHNDAESLEDHARLLATSGYYKKAMGDKGNADKFANDLTGVYATDPNYGKSLTQIMKQYNLYRYDHVGSTGGTSSGGTSSSGSHSSSGTHKSGGSSSGSHSSGGGTYTVQSGDSLSRIASQHGVSLAALEKANPQIKNFNVIYPGEVIHLPGGSSTGGSKAKPPAKTGGTSKTGSKGNTSGDGTAAYRNATEVLGHNISQLKYSGPLAKYLDKWPGNNVCCANFVSACLDKAGEINHSEHNDSVRGLAANLRNDRRWGQVSLKDAKPGDVVCFHVPGEGDYGHVVMFAGWKNGKPQFIGSNNVNSDGTQRITQGYMGYSINAIFHYHG